MSVHAMSPILEEDLDSTTSTTQRDTLLFDDDDDDEAYNLNPVNAAVNVTIPDGKEEEEVVKTSSSTRTIVPVRDEKQDPDGEFIFVGYFFQVPCARWHPKLEMMSKPALSQGQYERKVLDQGFQIPEEIDEFIRIDCPDMPLGVSRTFSIRRSALMRSPVLANFFASLDYLPGCKMGLHFMNDPGVCFEVVQTYLENGPDCYPMLRLKVYITRLTKNADRFLVLLRLHKFAAELELIHLKNMALEVIYDLEWEMSADCCPKIAQLVFAHQSPYDNTIKLWALKHIGHFYRKLSRSSTWASLVPVLDAELGEHWATMQASGNCVLSMIAEEATDEAVSDVLARFSSLATNSAVSAVKGSSTSSSPTKSEASTQTDDSSLTETAGQPEISMLPHESKVEKPAAVTPKGRKNKRLKAMTNRNQFVVGMHKEWVITCTPSKQSKLSPNSSQSASPTTYKPEVGEGIQPTITISQYEEDSSIGSDHKITLAIKSVEEQDEDVRKQREKDDNEWEDEEEEVAIQEAVRSFGATPRDDSKAREVLGLPERAASIDGPPRPQDENAKARRVLGINDDGGGYIAGRKVTRMMRVKKSLTRFNDFLNP